ncbi:MAG: hypothetical protein MK209_08885 [Planctomycetes bacterium]|nr:hypothetical protein [Planctomycetota bacterium]
MIGNALRFGFVACVVMLSAATASSQEIARLRVDAGTSPIWAGSERMVKLEFALPVAVIEQQLISVFRRPLDLPVRLDTRAWGDQEYFRFEPLREESSGGVSFVWDGQFARAKVEPFMESGEAWNRYTVHAWLRFSSTASSVESLQLPRARLTLTYATEWEKDFLGERMPVDQREWVGDAEVSAFTIQALPDHPRAEQSSGVLGPVRLSVERLPQALYRGEDFQVRVIARGQGLSDTLQVIAPEGEAWAWLGSIREDDGTLGSDEQHFRFDGRLLRAGEWTLAPFEVLRFDSNEGSYILEQSESQTLFITGSSEEPQKEVDVDRVEDFDARSIETTPAWISVLFGAGLLAFASWARQALRRNVAAREAQAFTQIEQVATVDEDAIEPLQLWLATRLEWPCARLSGPGTARRLREVGIEAVLAEQVADFLSEAEAMRYGGPPLVDAGVRRETLRRALDVVMKALAS